VADFRTALRAEQAQEQPEAGDHEAEGHDSDARPEPREHGPFGREVHPWVSVQFGHGSQQLKMCGLGRGRLVGGRVAKFPAIVRPALYLHQLLESTAELAEAIRYTMSGGFIRSETSTIL